MDTIRMGIIGFGNMGTGHCKNIFDGKIPGMVLGGICDILEERREAARAAYPGVPVYASAAEFYESGSVDAVEIAVPHYDHPSLAIDAFAHGIHVLVEKPAGVYTKQVLEMNEAAQKSGLVFGIMYNQRTNPVYQKIRQLVQSGELGHIKRINWTITNWYRPQAYHDSGTWRSTWKTEGGGTLINQNPHQLDLWQWMFGMPSRIMSHVSFGKYYNIEVEDDVTAYMEYDNGTTGVYITSTGEAPGTNRLEIACDMGQLIVENNKIVFYRNVVSEREFNKKNNLVFGQPESWRCEIPVSQDGGEQHVGIFKDFARALQTGSPLLAPGVEGVNGLTISNAIHYSAWTGGWADVKNFPHEEFYELLQERIKASKVVKKEAHVLAGTENTYNNK
ncbi:MAG: Gfo/Idh/MocA family oxidoreductase [Lachnospiraceae bacterium]|nr:Gfo/Idh/MocA family oxidoreductase [Lachnospiraceae bacterium]